MEIKTFRAKTMQQALNLVRHEMGAEATVLHTRELNTGLLGRLLRGREFEIAASAEMDVPARLTSIETTPPILQWKSTFSESLIADVGNDLRGPTQQQHSEQHELNSLATQLQQRSGHAVLDQSPESLFQAYTDLIESDIEERVAQELIDRLQNQPGLELHDPYTLQSELERLVADELRVSGPIEITPGKKRMVALVGPTGVGKTTTIAKLAANYRLRENQRVGLITVDTYRIAAVEQLRTYADIIDLPMEVVSTPREMREAKARLGDLDLVLMDTAGRSPRDEVRIQELKSMLSEAEPDEVHLVLSAVGSARSLVSTAERFAAVGTTAMVVTKLDEATGLGNMVSVSRSSQLPISYVTDGQNVPDDIQVAKSDTLAQQILNSNP